MDDDIEDEIIDKILDDFGDFAFSDEGNKMLKEMIATEHIENNRDAHGMYIIDVSDLDNRYRFDVSYFKLPSGGGRLPDNVPFRFIREAEWNSSVMVYASEHAYDHFTLHVIFRMMFHRVRQYDKKVIVSLHRFYVYNFGIVLASFKEVMEIRKRCGVSLSPFYKLKKDVYLSTRK
jgi:hypothetical protein